MMRYNFLLRELVVRDLKVRYSGSFFGFVWAFVHPLWQLMIYSVVFSGILRTPLVGEGTRSFSVFLFSGILMWMGFSEGLQRGTVAVVEGAQLVKKLSFPSQILVIAAALSAILHSGIAIGVFLLLRIGVGGVAWMQLPVFLYVLALQFVLTCGIALLLAGFYVFLRDVTHALNLVFSFLFFLTPIVYPIGVIPSRFVGVVAANPLSTVVAGYRSFFVQSAPPSVTAVLGLTLVAVAVFALGWSVFSRLSRGFADEL
jgi:ABC-2 type transport system permease protein